MQRRRRPCALQWSAWSIDGPPAQRGVHRRRRYRPASSRDRPRYPSRRSLRTHGSRAQRPVSHGRHRLARPQRRHDAQPQRSSSPFDAANPSARSFRSGSSPPRSCCLSSASAFFARWRVRLSYPCAILVLWFALPTPRSADWGAPLGVLGLFIRARAAGNLHKQEALTVTGPYVYTRNPLYFGSAILTLAAAVATRSWISAAILFIYFAIFYSIVMRREESDFRHHHAAAFDEYARAVPLFFPRLTPAKLSFAGSGSFSFPQYKKNHEYQAAIGFALILAILMLIWWVRQR